MIFFVNTSHLTDVKALSFVLFYQGLSTSRYDKVEISVKISPVPLPRFKNEIFKSDLKEITHIYLKNDVYVFMSDWHDSLYTRITKFKSSLNWGERTIGNEKLILRNWFLTYWEFKQLDDTFQETIKHFASHKYDWKKNEFFVLISPLLFGVSAAECCY